MAKKEAKKEAKKVVDVCEKCGKAPCACVKEEVKKIKEEIKEEDFSTKIMQDGTRYKVYPDGKEELIK